MIGGVIKGIMPELQIDISVIFYGTCYFVLYQVQHVFFIFIHAAQILIFDGQIIFRKCMRCDVDTVVSNAVCCSFRQWNDLFRQYIFYREYFTVLISGLLFSHLQIANEDSLTFCNSVFPVAYIGRICRKYIVSIVQRNEKVPWSVRIGNLHCADGQYSTRRTSDPLVVVGIVQT